MNRGLSIFGCLCLLLTVAACQRVIDIKIGDNSQLLVIEGNITNVQTTQTLTISNSVPYDSANVYPAVSKAVVTLNNGLTNYSMKEGKSGQYTLANFKGRMGVNYSVTVKLNDAVYTAKSTMPNPVNLDSINVSGIAVGSKTVKTVSAYYHDPPTEKNQYHFVLYVNGVQVKRFFAADDTYTNGRLVNTSLYQDDITIKPGDKVEVDMQCVDPPIYDYWYNLSQQGGNGIGNSATPSNPTSNFDNGALGYFSAHTTQRKSIIVN